MHTSLVINMITDMVIDIANMISDVIPASTRYR